MRAFFVGAGLCLAGWAALCPAADLAGDADAALPSLKFGELFKQPIGARGLEPGPRLLELAGRRVRLVGYAAHLATPMSDATILAPQPVSVGDEDESYADDLPAGVVYVHDAAQHRGLHASIERCPGPASLVGTLEVGARSESDGRISFVRLSAESARCLARPTG